MVSNDYYSILGVNKKATKLEIEAAYKRFSKKYHPDLNPGNKEAEEKMKAINEAKEVLCDPEKRKKYDEPSASNGPFNPIKKTPSQEMEDLLRKTFNKF